MCHFEMHTKATKSWNALKRWTGEWREGAWLTPTMQKIRRYVLEYMNIKGGRLFLYTFRNCQKHIKMTGHAKIRICSSQGDFSEFPRHTYGCSALSSSPWSELWYLFGGGFTGGRTQAKPMSSGLGRWCGFEQWGPFEDQLMGGCHPALVSLSAAKL